MTGPTDITTPIFGVGLGNGSGITWTYQGTTTPMIQAQSSAPGVASPVQTTSSQSTSGATGRPPYSLDTDKPGQSYKIGNWDCLLDTSNYVPACWDLLNIDAWLQNWFLTIKPCGPGENDANCRDVSRTGQGQEPWTTTFLREAGYPGSDCTAIQSVSNAICPAPAVDISHAGESPLTSARYRYVVYSILSRYSNGATS